MTDIKSMYLPVSAKDYRFMTNLFPITLLKTRGLTSPIANGLPTSKQNYDSDIGISSSAQQETVLNFK